MNVYVVMSWSARAGAKCVGLNMNERSARNMAERAVEEYIDFSGCDGYPANNEGGTEFWPENAEGDFRVRIETKKVFINFANSERANA